MSHNIANLTLRFILEMVALAAIGIGSAYYADGVFGVMLGIVVAVLAATLWGVFRVVGDDLHGRPPTVAVAGWVRLLLEAAFFSLAVLLVRNPTYQFWLAALIIFHYAISYDRIGRLVRA